MVSSSSTLYHDLYLSTQVSDLVINSPSAKQGTIHYGGKVFSFTSHQFNQTVTPGTYSIQLYKGGHPIWSDTVTLAPGEQLTSLRRDARPTGAIARTDVRALRSIRRGPRPSPRREPGSAVRRGSHARWGLTPGSNTGRSVPGRRKGIWIERARGPYARRGLPGIVGPIPWSRLSCAITERTTPSAREEESSPKVSASSIWTIRSL